MIHMKAFNEEFQFSDVERSENQKRDPASVADVRSQRTKMLLDIAEGRSDSVSVRDVLAAGDHLFSDLGMQDNLNSGMTAPPSPKPSTVAAKGGF